MLDVELAVIKKHIVAKLHEMPHAHTTKTRWRIRERHSAGAPKMVSIYNQGASQADNQKKEREEKLISMGVRMRSCLVVRVQHHNEMLT